MNVRFFKAAQIEFDSAVEYYETQLSGLGVRYRHEVLQSLERIKLFPDAYSPISKRTRRCLVSQFPYGIIPDGSGHDPTINDSLSSNTFPCP